MKSKNQTERPAGKPGLKNFLDEIVTLEQLQEARLKANKSIAAVVTFKADSFEAAMLEIATKHYADGVVDLAQALNLTAKLIITDWLRQRVDLPTLELGSAGYPLRRVEAELTKLD